MRNEVKIKMGKGIERERDREREHWLGLLAMRRIIDSPSVEEVQGRQCHGRAVNFGHGRLGSRNALDLFKVGAKQLANFNVVKQDGIFGTHVKPELKKIYKTTADDDYDDDDKYTFNFAFIGNGGATQKFTCLRRRLLRSWMSNSATGEPSSRGPIQ